MEENNLKIVTRKIRVQNSCGLHTRPATMIVQCLQQWQADVFFSYKKECVDARSILNLLLLAVPKNGEITISAKGEDAKGVVDQLSLLFEQHFGEKNGSL